LNKIIYSPLGGGLGNRLGGLINIKFIANMYNMTPCIQWPANNACGCRFEDIYVSDQVDTQVTWDEKAKNNPNINYLYLIHKLKYAPYFVKNLNLSLPNKTLIECGSSPSRQQVMNFKNYNEIMLTTDNTWPIIPIDVQSRILFDLNLQPCLKEKINAFKTREAIDRNFIGLHIRQTDHTSKIPLENYLSHIQSILEQNKNQKFFVCSDSRDTEDIVKDTFPAAVVTYPKDSYVKKYDEEKEWTTHYPARWEAAESPKKEFGAGGYNVIRDKESVLEAIIDMYLLSYTTVSNFGAVGTYQQIAKRLSEGRRINNG
tara:strand:- start:1116 stop:2060 length:945 start_codon:yes stop_codon:yes gene_type:complete